LRVLDYTTKTNCAKTVSGILYNTVVILITKCLHSMPGLDIMMLWTTRNLRDGCHYTRRSYKVHTRTEPWVAKK